jgi:hypothetical protein
MPQTITLSKLTITHIEIDPRDQYARVSYTLRDDGELVKLARTATFWRKWPLDTDGSPMPEQEDWYLLTAAEAQVVVQMVQVLRNYIVSRELA